MAKPVIMPRQGQSVESCIVTKWLKKPGDPVAVGDLLFSYETDKAAFDEAAKDAGTLLVRFFEEGDDVPCLTNMCVIGEPGESYAEFDPRTAEGGEAPAEEAKAAEAPAAAAAEAEETAQPVEYVGEMKISPRARALAEKSGAILTKAVPTGPDGRIIARDVQKLIDEGLVMTPAARAAYQGGDVTGTGLGGRVTIADLNRKDEPAAAAAPAPAAQAAVELGAPNDDSYTEPMSNIRKVIAKQMVLSLSSMAQLTQNLTFDATEIQAMRKLFKEQGEEMGMSKVTLNDIVMFAVSRTLTDPAFKALNANLIDDGKTMKYFNCVNLGMAVDTERGLMVPTIFAADRMTLKQLSDTAKKLAKDCQTGSCNPDYLRGGSFTVTNLGNSGVESFTPVINPPQTGILGVCSMTTRVREVNGQLQVYPAMNLSLTFDHRAIDGAPASKFLKALKFNLEHFTLLLAKG